MTIRGILHPVHGGSGAEGALGPALGPASFPRRPVKRAQKKGRKMLSVPSNVAVRSTKHSRNHQNRCPVDRVQKSHKKSEKCGAHAEHTNCGYRRLPPPSLEEKFALNFGGDSVLRFARSGPSIISGKSKLDQLFTSSSRAGSCWSTCALRGDGTKHVEVGRRPPSSFLSPWTSLSTATPGPVLTAGAS